MKSAIRRLGGTQSGPPIPFTAASGRRNGLMFDLGGGRQSREAQMRQYGRSGTIYSIVALLAESAAAINWHLYKKAPVDGRRRYTTADKGDDQRVEVTVHAALKLWQKPNMFHSGFEFREGAGQHEELTGETIWVLNSEGVNFPTSMWYVRPDRMEPVPDPDEYLTGWLYTAPNGETIPLKLNEVIVEKLPDPLDPFRGAGPVGSIMPNIDQQRYATEYQRNLFMNGADPGSIITVPTHLSEAEFDELVDRWRESHQGVARAGRVGVLENGATWAAPAGTSNKDLEYGNLRLANREEMREAWRVHPAMLGLTDDINRANAQTAEEVHVAWQVIPRLERRKDTLNSKLLPLFGDGQQDQFEFDYEDPSPVNQEAANEELLAKAQAAQALVTAGYDPSDVLEAVGLPDMGVVEKATQMPAAPPAWVPAPPAAPAGGQGNSAGGQGNYAPAARQTITVYDRNAAAKVFEQTAADYPLTAMAWMHHATWTGPVSVPLNHIQPDMEWLDKADPHHVAQFVDDLRAGLRLKPLLLVKTPGNPKLQLVDGHHRYLAEEHEGTEPRAFIGTVDTDHGPWETMHDHQINGPSVASLALRPYTARALEPAALNRSGK